MILNNPWGLLGLLGLPIVLVLHLLRERGRSYWVSSLSLWKFLEPEVRGSRFKKVPITWLLIIDLLIALFLSAALARPKLILSLPLHNARHLVILLDTSTSMNARDSLPNRISRAKLAATDLLNRLGPRDIATVLAFDSRSLWVGDTRQDSFQDLLTKVTNLQAGGIGNSVEEALALGVASLDRSLPVEFHILSDGAFPPLALERFPYSLTWHIFGEDGQNQAVLDLSVLQLESDQFQVYTRLANLGNASLTRVVSLLIEGIPYDSTTVDLPGRSNVDQVWRLSGKPSVLTVSLLGGDILKEDDNATIGVRPAEDALVIIVSDLASENLEFQVTTSSLFRAIMSIPNLDIQVVSPSEYSPLAQANLTIFEGVLPNQLPENVVLLASPPTGSIELNSGLLSIGSKLDLPKQAPVDVDISDPLMSGLNFSGVRWGKAFGLESLPSDYEILLRVGEIPVILENGKENNRVILLLADLESGNFTKHPVFPLFFMNLIQSVRLPSFPDALRIGEKIELPPTDRIMSLQITPPDGETNVFIGDWPSYWSNTLTPGPYTFELEDKAGTKSTYVIGINAGDHSESDLQPRYQADIQADNRQTETEELEQGVELLPWLLGIVILLLIFEAVLAWR